MNARRSQRIRRAVAIAACLVGLFAATDVVAADEAPVWQRYAPESTISVYKFGPEGLGPLGREFERRLPGLHYRASGDTRSAIVAAALLNDSPIGFVLQPRRAFPNLAFDALDHSRGIVFAASTAPTSRGMSRLRNGLPPVGKSFQREVLLIRAFVPADDAGELAGELRGFCRHLGTENRCSSTLSFREREGWVQFDFPIPGHHPEALEVGNSDREWRETPALGAFRDASSGFTWYLPARGIQRFVEFLGVEGTYDAVRFARSYGRHSGGYYSRALEQIAGGMLNAATEDPGTREHASLTFHVEGGDGSMEWSATQSLTEYGRRLYEAGATDVALPTSTLERPMGRLRIAFDLSSALEEASEPSLTRRSYVDRSSAEFFDNILDVAEGVPAIRAGMTRPITALRGVRGVLDQMERNKYVKPGPFSRVLGGTAALKLSPEFAVNDSGPRGFVEAVRGGTTLVFKESRAAGAFLNVVDAGKMALDLPIRSNTERVDGRTYVTLRLGTKSPFGDPKGGSSGSDGARAAFAGDRMLALLQTVHAFRNRRLSDVWQVTQFTRDAVFKARSGSGGRWWVAHTKGREVDAPDLGAPAGGNLPAPESRPDCLERSIATSVRLFASGVAGIASDDDTSYEVKVDREEPAMPDALRDRIEAFVDDLDGRVKTCRSEKDGAGARVERIRRFWKGALEGETPLHPEFKGEDEE